MNSLKDPMPSSRRALRLSRIDRDARWVDLDDPDVMAEDTASEFIVDAETWQMLEQLYRESDEE
jgi:hypothetical protein